VNFGTELWERIFSHDSGFLNKENQIMKVAILAGGKGNRRPKKPKSSQSPWSQSAVGRFWGTS
jgi:hypothetical protein